MSIAAHYGRNAAGQAGRIIIGMDDLAGFGVTDPDRLIRETREPWGVGADGRLIEQTEREYDATGLPWPDALPGKPV